MSSRRAIIYVYRSPIGMVSIRENLSSDRNWILCFEVFERSSSGTSLPKTQPVSIWPTPEEAARAVLEQRTRYPMWDQLPFVVFPAALEDWQEVSALEEVPDED